MLEASHHRSGKIRNVSSPCLQHSQLSHKHTSDRSSASQICRRRSTKYPHCLLNISSPQEGFTFRTPHCDEREHWKVLGTNVTINNPLFQSFYEVSAYGCLQVCAKNTRRYRSRTKTSKRNVSHSLKRATAVLKWIVNNPVWW
jgi:hypothetical protein